MYDNVFFQYTCTYMYIHAYTRTQGHRKQEGGMGLGLVCLAERVKALGGTYGACLRTDQKSGSVIWFKIPFPNPDSISGMISRKSISPTPTETEITDATHDKNINSREPAIFGLNVLVVDDSITILKMMVFILKKAGANVVNCKNGREAVEKTKEMQFDIIITDIQMPVLDGYSATREIREWEVFHSIKPKIIIGKYIKLRIRVCAFCFF